MHLADELIYDELQNDQRCEQAKGDTLQKADAGFVIVGTTPQPSSSQPGPERDEQQLDSLLEALLRYNSPEDMVKFKRDIEKGLAAFHAQYARPTKPQTE